MPRLPLCTVLTVPSPNVRSALRPLTRLLRGEGWATPVRRYACHEDSLRLEFDVLGQVRDRRHLEPQADDTLVRTHELGAKDGMLGDRRACHGVGPTDRERLGSIGTRRRRGGAGRTPRMGSSFLFRIYVYI